MEGLAPADWHALATMARQHRLEPLLHRNLDASPHWPVPRDISQRWRRSFRRNAFRALACERVIGEIARQFDASQIPYAALKGAWLAFHAYPHPALRPLRDVDMLVPAECARQAYDLLREHGFTPRNRSEPLPGHAMLHGKHLPGLVSPAGGISIEIHHRLLTPDPSRDTQILATDDVLARRITLGSSAGGIAYPAPTDMLLHLIIHAVHEHGFCNGPLILTDMAHLLETATVDWDRLWDQAERGGRSEGCRLMLGLARHYLAIRAPQPAKLASPPERVLRMAALMMLQDHARRGRIDLLASLGTAPGVVAKLNLAARRAWPRHHALAAFAGRASDRRFHWLHYPAWLASRLRLVAGTLMMERHRADIQRARALKSWLGAKE